MTGRRSDDGFGARGAESRACSELPTLPPPDLESPGVRQVRLGICSSVDDEGETNKLSHSLNGKFLEK